VSAIHSGHYPTLSHPGRAACPDAYESQGAEITKLRFRSGSNHAKYGNASVGTKTRLMIVRP
jgi:hypothetical protein